MKLKISEREFNPLYFLQFLPSITFNLLGRIEIFPYAFLRSLSAGVKIIDRDTLIVIWFVLISAVYGLFIHQELSFELVRSLLAYFNCIFIFLYVLKFDFINKDSIKILFITLVIIGFIQYFGLFNNFFSSVIEFLIPRGKGGARLSEGGRGVSLLSTEPQRAYINLVFIYLLLKKFYRLSNIYDFMFFCFSTVAIRSFTGFIMCGLMIFLFSNKIYFLSIFSATISFLYSYFYQSRIFTVINSLFQSTSISELIDIFINQSGFRVVSILSSFKFSLTNPFGAGIGNWKISSLQAYNQSGFDPSKFDFFVYFTSGVFVPLRPTSFIANIALDFGIIGILFFLFYLFRVLIKYSISMKKNKNYLVMFFFYLFFFGEVGNPVPWISIAYILKSNE